LKAARGGRGRRDTAKATPGGYVARYLQAVLDKDRGAASAAVVSMLDEGFDMISVFRILSEAQIEIGKLWEKGIIGISDEGFSTATTLECIAEVAFRSRRVRRETRGMALLSTAEGEFHQVALAMLRELLRERGWGAEVLSHDAPLLDLLSERSKKGRIDVICFSVVMPASLPPLVEVLDRIRTNPRFNGTKIIVGGPLFKSKAARSSLVDRATGTNLADHVSTDFVEALEYLDSLDPRLIPGK
jgi:methanogenic corrinoid protein MtbC1